MPAGQEILGGGPFRHHRDVRQAFRAVLQCDEMPMDRDTLDAQAVRAAEWRDCRDLNTGCDRHGGDARLHVVAMLAAVGRADRHAHAFAQPVWRLVRPHIDHIDLEIRIQRVWYTTASGISSPCSPAPSKQAKLTSYSTSVSRGMTPGTSLWGVHWQHQHFGGGFRSGADHDVAFVEGQSDATQKRSSASRYTSTSSVTGVPTRWRITAYGRHAPSSST